MAFFLVCGIMSLAEPCVYAEGSIRRKTHGDDSRRGIMSSDIMQARMGINCRNHEEKSWYYGQGKWIRNEGTNMSAIWGAIDLQGNPIKEEQKKLLRKAFDKCVIDRYEEMDCENVYMGCGIQYFTPEAKSEVLPKNQGSVFFTADVVLDNRRELCEKLNISSDTGMPDGELLYEVYKKYGKSCLNDLLGAYTFVWYDKQRNEIELVLDAVGNRCLYYRLIGSILYFSSLIEPLAQMSQETGTNDRWLVDFLAMDHLFMINETEETPIKDIYRIAPAQYIKIDKTRKKKETYWKPFENYQEYHWKSDEEYKNRFCELWDTAVKDVMRTDTETAILLSGGLDSTAVAAIAAPYLKQQGKKLYSFTSVPMKGYQQSADDYYIEDETQDVKKTAQFFGNIETDFVDLGNKTPWEMMKREFQILEIPFKSVQNSLWIVESMRRAYQKGARLILSGSYGNTTISYTDLYVYMNTLFTKKRYRKLKQEVEQFSKTMGFQQRYALEEIYHTGKQKYEKNTYPYGNSYVNRTVAEELGTVDRLIALDQDIFESSRNFDLYRYKMVNFWAFRQIGEIVTKHSLTSGVLLRDPTIDKRVIEFCIHLPMEQFCKEGIDRRLVKEYLKDIIPSHVIRFQKQGKQSADLCYRFEQNNWDQIRQEWIQIYEKYEESHLVDVRYARRQLLEQKECKEYSAFDLTRHMYTIQVLQYEDYLKKHYQQVNYKEEKSENSKEDNQPLLSVIIPVYNVKEYLQCCVESVCKQTYHNLEIILIDDGSTDGSDELCDRLKEQDNRIHVIHKENGGVSSARNTGMDVASGELIAFVDSDDWIEPEMYQKLSELMREQDADWVCCGYRRIMNDKINDFANNQVRVFSRYELMDTYITEHGGYLFSPAVWNRLYKRESINNFRFPLITKYEDCVMNTYVMPRVKKGVFINKSYYNYRMRDSSLTHKKLSKADIEAYIYANREQRELIVEQLGEESKRTKYFNDYCVLLDMYCKVRKDLDNKGGKKLLKQELQVLRKRAREGIKAKRDIGRRDKIQLLASTYSVESYFMVGKVINKLKF